MLGLAELGLAELGEDCLEHLRLGDARVQNQRGIVIRRVEFVEKPAAERRFSAAHLTDENDEALLFLYPIFQMLQSLQGRGARIKKTRIRGDVEGHLLESVKTLIH